MRKTLAWVAEPLAIVGIVLALTFAAHTVLAPVRVGGWSMGPALCPGDIALVRLGDKPIVGDIALVREPGHQPVLHRVVEVMDGGSVRTKGDANAVADRTPVTAPEVAGRCVAVLPVGAWIARWRGQSAYATMASQPNNTRR
jgi:signal peptidase I